MTRSLTAALLLSALAACATQTQVVAERDGRLTDAASGRTLYTFDKDGPNASACTGNCATMWPPFAAAEGVGPQGDFGLVMRNDGTRQWSYKGKPLYHFSGDTKPGEAKGEGMGGVWHSVAMGAKPKPAGSSGYDTIKGNY